MFKEFDKVLVKDHNGYWRANIFKYESVHVDNKTDDVVIYYTCIDGKSYNECIVYEGNESLVNTKNTAFIQFYHNELIAVSEDNVIWFLAIYKNKDKNNNYIVSYSPKVIWKYAKPVKEVFGDKEIFIRK